MQDVPYDNYTLIHMGKGQGGLEHLNSQACYTDGTYRIMPKQIPGQEGLNTKYVLYSIGDSTPTLTNWDFSSDNAKWNFKQR